MVNILFSGIDSTFSKAELSVDIHHPCLMFSPFMSVLLNSPCIAHLFSQLIYDGEHLYLTYFVFARYLLSVCLLYM